MKPLETPRGLSGSIGLIAAHSASLGSYRMIQAPLRSLNHASGDAFNNEPAFPRLPPERTCSGHAKATRMIRLGLMATRKSTEAYMTDCNHVAKAWIVFSRG
jgi:hypothetical protein